MLLLLIASFNKLVSRISLTRPSFAAAPRQSTAYSGTLLGVHFQSPRRNFGAGSMRNAPCVRDASFFVFDAIEREISLSNNATLIQSELISMSFITYDKRECCFCSARAKTLAFDCTFQCCSFKKDIATDLDRD